MSPEKISFNTEISKKMQCKWSMYNTQSNVIKPKL